jgi:hypothetical protein
MDVFTARLWGYTPRVAADRMAQFFKKSLAPFSPENIPLNWIFNLPEYCDEISSHQGACYQS